MRALGDCAQILGVAVLAVLASAATFRVEKDGSGDFTVIQDALNVAAEGDTVLVGAGRFDDFRAYDDRDIGAGAGTAVAYFPESHVNLIGLGRERSWIGPDSLVLKIDDLDAIGLHLPPDVVGIRVEGFLLENINLPVNLYASGVTIHDCEFGQTGSSGTIAIVSADDFTVTKCHFEILLPGNFALASFVGRSQNGLHVLDTTITITSPSGVGMSLDSIDNVVIDNCEVGGGLAAVRLLGCPNARIANSRFAGQYRWPISIRNQGVAPVTTIVDCELLDPGLDGALVVDGPTDTRVENCVLEGGSRWVIHTEVSSGLQVRNSHIVPRGEVGILVDSFVRPGIALDLRENWWGTTDESQIEAWIVDALDDATVPSPLDTVLFRPILPGPVESRTSSMGALKSRFNPTN